MNQGNQFRCYPNKALQSILHKWIGHQRFIYNAKVTEDRYFRKFLSRFVEHGDNYSLLPIDQKYSQFIDPQLTPWLKEVPSQILRNGAYRWRQAYGRFFKKLAGRPKIKKRSHKQSVFVTKELFRFVEQGEHCFLELGTVKKPVGVMEVIAHNAFKTPSSITLTCEGSHWTVSLSFDDEVPEPERNDIGEQLEQLSEKELLECTVGIDRNTPSGEQIAASNRQSYTYSDTELARMAKKQARKKKYQKRMARQTVNSNAYRKNKIKARNCSRYIKAVRKDFAHKTSHAFVSDPRSSVFVLENLKIANMVKKAKPKVDEQTGKWLKNGACAKSGLNKSILNSSWGQVATFLEYKANRANKLVVKVNPVNTSRECNICGHTTFENRLTQADFLCQNCGHQDNADFNASTVIKGRGIELVLSGGWRQEPSKKIFSGTVGSG